MADVENLETRLKALEHKAAVSEDIEAIKRLKYKYFRSLDRKLWGELSECFTEDATTSYSGGKHTYQGRDAIMNFLSKSLSPTILSMHHGHHPEIEITGKKTATGVWALHDYVIVTQSNVSLRGASFYHDEYVKVGGEWKIKHTGYERVFEEVWDRGETRSLRITANMFAPRGE